MLFVCFVNFKNALTIALLANSLKGNNSLWPMLPAKKEYSDQTCRSKVILSLCMFCQPSWQSFSLSLLLVHAPVSVHALHWIFVLDISYARLCYLLSAQLMYPELMWQIKSTVKMQSKRPGSWHLIFVFSISAVLYAGTCKFNYANSDPIIKVVTCRLENKLSWLYWPIIGGVVMVLFWAEEASCKTQK